MPAPLPDEVLRRLRVAARRAFGALGLAGYGRADFRVTRGGEVVFLEMNPLPSLVPCAGHDELSTAAAHLGRSEGELIAAILDGAPRGVREPAPAALRASSPAATPRA